MVLSWSFAGLAHNCRLKHAVSGARCRVFIAVNGVNQGILIFGGIKSLSYFNKVSCIVPCLFCMVLMLAPPRLAAADALMQQHHQQQRQGCHACHTQRLPLVSDSNHCNRCHAGSDGDRTPGIQANGAAVLAKTPTSAPEGPATGLPPGMVVPMYYANSRIGSDPNPMIRIPAGDFIMGSDNRLEDEGPQYLAHSGAYRMDVYEVTNLQYKQFIDATHRRSPAHFRNRTFPEGKADHPVTFVSWFDAEAYCHWAGKRLPTENEWEKAARGVDGRIYPWGNEFELQAANTPVRWVELSPPQGRSAGETGDTTPVGAFPSGRSPYGLYDMSGNVWEWVADWYGPHPGNTGTSENYGHIYKILKGGSWWDCSFYKCGISAPTFNRSFFSPHVRNASFGFRCAADG